jgi:1,2-diacylglycerol 3-alpha-glucosyltransferase
MQIGLFTDSYLPNTDGVVSSILAIRRGLAAKGHSMTVFAPDAPGAIPEKGVLRFASVKFPPYPEYRAAIFPHVSSHTAKKHNIGIVHCKAMFTMALSAAWFAKRARLPSLASLETMVPEGVHYISKSRHVQEFGRRAAWAYLRALYSQFDAVSAPSIHAQATLQENGIESVVLPSPVDTARFRPDSAGGIKIRRKLGLAGKKAVLTVGRVVREKNYSFLLRAAKRMQDPDVRFVVVGRGPYLEQLKKEANGAGLGKVFIFAGFVPDSQLVSYYNAADAFAFPSSFETQGLTLLEALSCGKPAAVLRGTPMGEIVREGKNGFGFGMDETECARKLEECLARGKKLSKECRKSALEYSIPKCTERLVEEYRILME